MRNDAEASPGDVQVSARSPAIARFKLWHLVLLVAFVAVAIADIQDHRRTEPALIALAGLGFAAYAVLAWLGWAFARRFEGRVGRVALIGLYLATMAGLFLCATVAYLLIEHVYLGGLF
jgi:hypothetical protein